MLGTVGLGEAGLARLSGAGLGHFWYGKAGVVGQSEARHGESRLAGEARLAKYGWKGTVRSGSEGQAGLVRRGEVWADGAWCDGARPVRYGDAWRRVTWEFWFGEVLDAWCGDATQSLVWRDKAWSGRSGMAASGGMWCGRVRCGRYGVIVLGYVRFGKAGRGLLRSTRHGSASLGR